MGSPRPVFWEPTQFFHTGLSSTARAREFFLARDGLGQALSPGILLQSAKNMSIPPRTMVMCRATLKGDVPLERSDREFLFTPSRDLPKEIGIESFLGTIKENETYQIFVQNFSNYSVLLPHGSILGSIDLHCQLIGKISDDVQVEFPSEPFIQTKIETPQVDPVYAPSLLQLLSDFKDLFAEKNSGLGHTGLIKHTIDTQGKGPIRLRPYRSAQKNRAEMQRQVQEMLEAKVIQPSLSPWAFPVVLVEKKDGEQRFCIDYRKLNHITKKDSYPLPRIDDTFDMLHGKKFFTTLDLASGYWQIELEESAKEKTAFIVENNLYEFNRMSFGLCNAPATFQRLMNYVLRDVLGKSALVYLDDVIIFSESYEQHLIDIRKVFSLLQRANLKLKLKKCQFMKKSVDYLGHVISTEGIAPDPNKIDKIANYKVPISVDEVRSFLGLAGYYRRFVPNFGTIARPLTRKTHKDLEKEPFTWSEEDHKAFETLRTCLVTPPILAFPNFNLEFLLFTDACDYGIGAVLSQLQDGKEVVIAYASRQLQKAEIKYPTVEKEALAIIFAIKQFRQYLLDEPFTVISDHRPLQWLQDQKDVNGRLGRWAIALSAVNYKIRYRPGRIHQNADCLSRLKVASIQTVDIPRLPEIVKQQRTDETCVMIRNYLFDRAITYRLPAEFSNLGKRNRVF